MGTSLNFANQDLRHRCFRGQMLPGSDFSGADIRGCDFSRAQLVGADFRRSRAGQTRRQQGIWLAISLLTFLLQGHAVSNLVSGSMGQAPGDKAWNYVIVLGVSLAIAGGFSWSRGGGGIPFMGRAALLSSVASGAVAGFFYAGIAMGKQPQWAITGAVLGGLMAGVLGLLWGKRTSITLASCMAGAICAYGFFFLVGMTGLSFLNIQDWRDGILFMLLSLIYLGLTVRSLAIALHTLRHAPGTRFTQANLTDAQFTDARLPQTDFSQAIGV